MCVFLFYKIMLLPVVICAASSEQLPFSAVKQLHFSVRPHHRLVQLPVRYLPLQVGHPFGSDTRHNRPGGKTEGSHVRFGFREGYRSAFRPARSHDHLSDRSSKRGTSHRKITVVPHSKLVLNMLRSSNDDAPPWSSICNMSESSCPPAAPPGPGPPPPPPAPGAELLDPAPESCP